MRIAEKTDPLSPTFNSLGDALADAGRNEEAANICEKLAPDNRSRTSASGALVRQGKAGEVIQTYERDPAKRRSGYALGCAYAHSGRREEAEKVFAATKDISRTLILACLGDKDRLFEALDHDAAVGPIRMGSVLGRVDRESPGLLRGDPRLKALRKKVGLPE